MFLTVDKIRPLYNMIVDNHSMISPASLLCKLAIPLLYFQLVTKLHLQRVNIKSDICVILIIPNDTVPIFQTDRCLLASVLFKSS